MKRSDGKHNWWTSNQAKNLVALSAAVASDIETLLPPEIVGDWSPLQWDTAAALSLSRSLLKKFEYESSESADAAALSKFLAVNESCKAWTLRVESDTDRELVGELKNSLYKFFYPSGSSQVITSFGQILDQARTGPGASLGANGNDFFTKMFSSELTTTSESLYLAYRHYIESRENWLNADEVRSESFGPCRVVSGSRLSFVPKNVDISRTICVEPSLNMFYQLGLKQILEGRIKQFFGIDFTVQQSKNRDLAQLASMFDGQWSTIDLSSASDSLSMSMLREVLPPAFLQWLEAFRCSNMALPSGEQVELGMISTMGNGYTFPLQTLLFSCVVSSAHRVSGVVLERPRGHSLGNFGVYGDDIICRKEVTPLVLRLLELLGFTVNAEKSFFQGPFRESCGGDFFQGHQIRGVYIKRLHCEQDAYVALNCLNRWSATTGIYLRRAVRLLYDWVRRLGKPCLVPLYENDDAGLKVPRSRLKSVVLDKSVRSVQYRAFRAKPTMLRVCDAWFEGPSWLREGRLFNPSGLVVAFLGGYITGHCISVRHDQREYRSDTLVAPWWDFEGLAAGIAPAERRVPLGMAIDCNMG